MREFLTDKKFIKSKVLVFAKIALVIALIIFFLPLIVLPFFNHPFADDYFCGYYLNNKGFINYQSFIYNNWSGRFAATFTGSLFAHDGFLYDHYYLHSLLLLFLNFLSLFYLVRTFTKYILKQELSLSKQILFAFLLLALEICSLPECSTFLFWFSSAITYQLPVILTQFEICLLIVLLNSANKLTRIVCAVLLSLLVFVVMGFNELFIVVQAFILATIFYFKWDKRLSKAFISFMLLAFLSAGVLLILAKGNHERLKLISAKPFYLGIAAAIYHSAEALWNILKNPLFWFIGVVIFVYAGKIKFYVGSNSYIQSLLKKRYVVIAGILVFLVATVSLPVVGLKGGIIPDRYLNAIICFIIPALLFLFFLLAINNNRIISAHHNVLKRIIVYFLIIVGLLCNNYIGDAYKSLLIAPTYSTILKERETILKQAAEGGKVAVVNDYNVALSEMMNTKYSSSTLTFLQLIQQKPPLLFFEDDLATPSSIDVLKKYYDLDSIIIKTH